MLEGSNLLISSTSKVCLYLYPCFDDHNTDAMILLGTPSINVALDLETCLFFGCVLLSYSSLYFYFLWQEMKRETQRLKQALSQFQE